MRDQFIRQVKRYDNIFKAHELINEKHEDIKSLKCQRKRNPEAIIVLEIFKLKEK